MMKYELGLEKPDPKRATKSAIEYRPILCRRRHHSFSPYFFIADSTEALKYSVIATLIVCLFLDILKVR